MSQSLKSRLSTFAGNTDTHGVKFIASSDGSILRKVVWSVALLGSFLFLSYFFYIRVNEYLRYETSTKVEYTSNKREIKFPTIAVCVSSTFGRIVASRLTASDIINAENRDAGSLLLATEKITETINGKRYLKQEAINVFTEMVKNSSAISDTKAKGLWNNARDHKWLESKFRSYAGHNNWDQLIKTLAAHNRSEPIQDINDYRAWEVFERAGYRLKEVVSDVKCRNGNDFKYPLYRCPKNWRRYPGKPHCLIHDFKFGYHVEEISFLMKKKFLEDRSLGGKAGWFVEINPGEDSSLRFNVGDDQSATFTVNEVTRLRRLGPPYEECGDSSLLTTPVEGRYSASLCITECWPRCLDDYIEGKSSCRSLGRQSAEKSRAHLPVCTPQEEISAAEESRVKLECDAACRNGSFSYRTRCPEVSCFEDQYVVTEDIYSDDKFVIEKVLMKFSPQVKMTTFIAVPLLSMESLLGELGGTVGLFVGISLLTILHALEFILTEIWRCICGHVAGKEKKVHSSDTATEERDIHVD